jgi:hypothetical protein
MAFGRDIHPAITVNAVPFNLCFEAAKSLTLALAGGMFMNFDTTTGCVLKKTGTGRHFRQSVLKRQGENNHGDGAV